MSTKIIERNFDLDFLKAIGIVFMIMGHIWYGGTFEIIIHAFHIQLFYLVSGFLFSNKEESFTIFFKKKFKRLIIPYFSFGLFHLLVKSIFSIANRNDVISFFKQLFWINNGNFPIAGALWFLTSLFFVYLIYYWINKINNKIIVDLVIIFIVLFGFFVSNYILLPFSLNSSLVCIGLFHFGYRYKQLIYSPLKNKVLVVSILFIGIVIGILNGSVNIRELKFGNIFYFYISSCCIVLFLYYLANYYLRVGLPAKEMLFIGKNSLIYMAFNQILVWMQNKF